MTRSDTPGPRACGGCCARWASMRPLSSMAASRNGRPKGDPYRRGPRTRHPPRSSRNRAQACSSRNRTCRRRWARRCAWSTRCRLTNMPGVSAARRDRAVSRAAATCLRHRSWIRQPAPTGRLTTFGHGYTTWVRSMRPRSSPTAAAASPRRASRSRCCAWVRRASPCTTGRWSTGARIRRCRWRRAVVFARGHAVRHAAACAGHGRSGR